MSEDFEKKIAGCNNLKVLVVDMCGYTSSSQGANFRRLELKGKNFQVFQSASSSEITEFWDVLLSIETSLTRTGITKASLSKFESLNKFIDHCCSFHKYSVTIKKCGMTSCSMSRPVRMPLDIFSGISITIVDHLLFNRYIFITNSCSWQ